MYFSNFFCIDLCCAGSSDREHCSIEGSQHTSQCEPQADADFGNRAAVYDRKCKIFCPHTLIELLNILLMCFIFTFCLFLQRASLEEALHETKLRYGMQLEQYNGIILLRESELKRLRDDIHSQTLEYQALLNIKMELEAEIATYRRLLDGEDKQ